MKRLSILLIGIVFFVGAMPLTARAVYDPPHFSGDSFPFDECSSCHIANPHHGIASYPAALNDLCEACHFDGGPAPGVLAHSSRTIDNDYGDWEVDCWSCHEPHHQRQNDKYGTTYGKYIRTTFDAEEIKEINPNDPGPYFWPVSILRTVSSTTIEFKGPTEFVDGDPDADDDICQVCHLNTSYYNTGAEKNFHDDFGTDSQPEGNCTSCHAHTDGFKPSGGHADPDTIIVESTNCTTSGCHDGTITGTWTPVPDIHNNVCDTCHVSAGGGGPLWEPWETNNTNGGDCEDCHNGGVAAGTIDARAAIHHNFKYSDKSGEGGPAASDGSAVQGLCVTCHMPIVDPVDGPVDPSTLWISQVPASTGLACNWCHIYWPDGSSNPSGYTPGGYTYDSDKLKVFKLAFDPNVTPNTPSEPTETLLTTHLISEVTGSAPISDYSACLSCHGATPFAGSAGTAQQVFPYHGLGTPYNWELDQSVMTCGRKNDETCGGDADDIVNQYGTPQLTGTNQAAKTGSWHPGFRYIHDIPTFVWMGHKGYGNSTNQARFHETDEAAHIDSSPATYTQTHNIPWDDFAAGDPACFNTPPVPSTCEVNVNVGGQGTTAGDPKTTDMPVVPLSLP